MTEETIICLDLDPSNPFAFTPRQLIHLVDRKQLDLLNSIGGVDGLARGLHSNKSRGLDCFEENLEFISMYDLKKPSDKEEYEDKSHVWIEESKRFEQRTKVFGLNKLPELEPVSLMRIMWEAYQDKMLVNISKFLFLSFCLNCVDATDSFCHYLSGDWNL